MALTRLAGRQEPIHAYVNVALGDLVSGVQTTIIKLPGNVRVIGGRTIITTVFNSGTSDVLDIGDTDDDDEYTPSQLNAANAGLTAFTLTGVTLAAGKHITATITHAGTAATTGAFRVEVEYVVVDRVAFTQD